MAPSPPSAGPSVWLRLLPVVVRCRPPAALSLSLSWLCALSPALLLACGGGAAAPGDGGADPDAAAVDTPDGAQPRDRMQYPRLTLSFHPSNLPADLTVPDGPAVALTGKCVADGAAGTLTCAGGVEPDGVDFRMADQGDAAHTPIAVFACKSLSIAAGASLRITGPRAVALVVAGKLEVAGEIAAVPDELDPSKGNGGGASTPAAAGPGTGPGAGGGVTVAMNAGAGGGGYCGGGGGGGSPFAVDLNGGAPNGAAECKPLIGGSSGGRGSGPAGAGGGAIELVAGESIETAAGGGIHAGGGGGATSSGGGSGGAILLESPVVHLAGLIAVNGGGGGGANALVIESMGQSGMPSLSAALGGVGMFQATCQNKGGKGGYGDTIDGGRGTYDCAPGGALPDAGGAGGGGVGRIRINTRAGAADITMDAAFSPGVTSTCTTQGMLPG